MKKTDNKKTNIARRTVVTLIAGICGSAYAALDTQQTIAKKKSSSTAELWPTQPIKLVVGFPAGSVQDISARIIAEPLSKSLGQPVIVENKPGASGTIAATAVANATDSHTFGVMNNSQLTIAKLLNPAISYNPATDLSPVALIATTPMILVVSNAAVGTTKTQWIEWLQAQGSKGNFGSPGVGTPGHLGMELIRSRSGGLMLAHIPYQGNPQVITAMLSGQIQAALLPPGLAMQQIKAGKMRALGVTSEQRSVLAPDVPTLRELNIFGVDLELFSAVAGPAKMPLEIQEKFGAAVIDAVKTPESRQRLITAGWQPTPSAAEGLRSKIRSEIRKLGGIIIMRNISTEA